MQTYLDCYPCIIKQALNAARLVKLSEEDQHTIVLKVMVILQDISKETIPPILAHKVHQMVKSVSGINDPYQKAKRASTEEALRIYPWLKQIVSQSKTPLETAIRISIAGNIIDLGVYETYSDLTETVNRVLDIPFDINHLEQLKKALESTDKILFLGDNAGETVFDRVLLEYLPHKTTYVVKGGPILNDATLQDAIEAGLDKKATIVDNGSSAPGTIMELCSKDFLDLFKSAKVILAKGQANYESLSQEQAPIYFLLQSKCPVIARDLSATVGGIILKQSDQYYTF